MTVTRRRDELCIRDVSVSRSRVSARIFRPLNIGLEEMREPCASGVSSTRSDTNEIATVGWVVFDPRKGEAIVEGAVVNLSSETSRPPRAGDARRGQSGSRIHR